MLVTVQTIVDSALDLADMRNSKFVDVSGTAGTELIRYVNLAYKDVYAQIVLSKETYFTTSTTFSITSNTDSYPLPNDFYKLDGVDLQVDSSPKYITLKRFQFSERNKFRSGFGLSAAPYGQIYRYIVIGSNIKFVPLPSQSSTVQLWYTPEPTTITSFATSLALPIGADEYMSLYITCAILAKEESDITALSAKRLEVLDQLKNSLKDRDQGSAAYVVDESEINAGALYPFRGVE